MKLTVTSHENLGEILRGTGNAPDMRCGGRGTCGRCTVRLVSGEWEVAGEKKIAPVQAPACRTRLLSDTGTVEFEPAPGTGEVSSDWVSSPLPCTDETVIGIDIGTTTVAGVRVRNGKVLAKAGTFNAQAEFGDNVITRIAMSAEKLPELRAAVRKSVQQILTELGTDGVSRIAIAGNTVMSLLFHGIDPAPIGILPFTPPQRRFEQTDWDGIPLLTMPCISGYVGGDLTAGLYETQLNPGEMLVDIGTNCEIVFNTGSGILCTAAAAGPAFEGGGLYFGTRAVPGAVDHYCGEHDYSVIGNTKPIGFCGSAYVDFLAVERRNGHLNEFGRFEPARQKIHLTDEIFIHESDLAQLLKAKAAVHAGITTLEDHCGMKADKIYLAGGFSMYMDLANAKSAGMLPDRKYAVTGNTSLAGAARLAAAPALLPELEKLTDVPKELPLNTLPEFEDNFIDGLFLP